MKEGRCMSLIGRLKQGNELKSTLKSSPCPHYWLRMVRKCDTSTISWKSDESEDVLHH